MEMIMPAVVLGALGGIFALALGYAAKAFHVDVDETVERVRAALPGANCGGCGYVGCDACAVAIALEGAPVNICPVGGADCAEKIAEIMGADSGDMVKEVACVMCLGDKDKAKDRAIYDGIQDCRVNATTNGGNKGCTYGCLGDGSCVTACKFDAIHVYNGLAVVDKEKCVACGACVTICPRQIIKMVPYDQDVFVKCSSKDPGKAVRAVCSTGCIACKICEKQCPDGFKVENNLSTAIFVEGLDETQLQNAITKCPTKCITSDKGLGVKIEEQDKQAS